jgi:hypothetical protein
LGLLWVEDEILEIGVGGGLVVFCAAVHFVMFQQKNSGQVSSEIDSRGGVLKCINSATVGCI